LFFKYLNVPVEPRPAKKIRKIFSGNSVKNKLIIAIDGPVGSGKSTVARRVAELLGYTHLDSGAMYRAVAWKALQSGVPLDSHDQLEALAGAVRIDLVPQNGKLLVILDGKDITDLIRTPKYRAPHRSLRRSPEYAIPWWPSSAAQARRAAW
jgi:nicotinamide riboside kinase